MLVNKRNIAILMGGLAVVILLYLRSSPNKAREAFPGGPPIDQASPPQEAKSAPIAVPKAQSSLAAGTAETSTPNEAVMSTPELPKPDPESLRGPFRDSFLKDDEGRALIFFSQEEAAKACANRRMRLPTIRELARLGESRGAKGIRELSEAANLDHEVETLKPWTVQEGFILVPTLEADGKRDQFYYNHAGYVEPDPDQQAQLEYGRAHGGSYNDPNAAEVHILQYWSSSALPTDKQRLILYFGLDDGRIFAQKPTIPSHVRCVAGI